MNKLSLHGRILNEKSLGREIQHFPLTREGRRTRLLSLHWAQMAPAPEQAGESRDGSHFGQNDQQQQQVKVMAQSFTHTSISLILDPVSDLA